MVINISLLLVLKAIGFMAIQPFLALFCLFPINDQPTSNTQKAIYVIVNLVIFALLFGFVKINLGL